MKVKVIPVREHPRKVPVSPKNPQGITIVDRKILGAFMEKLKSNILIIILFFGITTGCQTHKVFEMKSDEKKELNVIRLRTNRIIHECYFLNAEKENQWRHQYLLNVLNEKGEVISIMYPTNQDIDSCNEHLKKVEKIFKSANEVKICARGILKKMVENNLIEEIYDYGALGKHTSPYYGLTFDTICNSKDCYSISDTWTYTCPDFKK